MKKVCKIIALISAFCLIFSCFAGCGLVKDMDDVNELNLQKEELQKIKDQMKETVLIVNDDIEISGAYYAWYFSSLYNEEYAAQYQLLQSSSSADSSAAPVVDTGSIKEQAKKEIATVKLAYKKALEENIKLSKEDKAVIKDQINQFKSNISQQGISYDDYLLLLNTNAETIEQIVTEEYMGNLYYASLAKNYYATSKHILIQFGGTNRTKEKAETLANDIKARIDAGEDFDKLMEEYSEDGRGQDGKLLMPDGYTFTIGEMVAQFEDKSFELKEGEVSEPVLVESSGYSGYHIIKKMPLNTSEVVLSMLNNGTPSIMGTLIDAEKNSLSNDATFKETDKINFYTELFN